MSDKFSALQSRAKAFSNRLREEHCIMPRPRSVLSVEADLGHGAVAGQLTHTGKRLLFRALDLERKAKLHKRGV